jgi:hypothetical protein
LAGPDDYGDLVYAGVPNPSSSKPPTAKLDVAAFATAIMSNPAPEAEANPWRRPAQQSAPSRVR